ncbi:spore germination protein Q [Evansella vedderi]|uniref:Spore germination protein Q n=1 Tax=Evansella vedderi TaxID=38282 RepID=A0ABU0A4Z1_9BACI|nr:spore coat protein GerQ [Evansella vedderi]MDQ0257410.1 spore germination protein Q [Evansella vedderi]
MYSQGFPPYGGFGTGGFPTGTGVPAGAGAGFPTGAGFQQPGTGFPQTGAGFQQPGAGFPTPGFAQQQPAPPPPAEGQLPLEQSFIENILRLNRGKVGTFYMTFENNERWNAKVFKGVVEAAGRDHIILSDPQTGKRFLLLMVNLDYVTFDEPLKYEYDWPGATAQNNFAEYYGQQQAAPQTGLATYAPRDDE